MSEPKKPPSERLRLIQGHDIDPFDPNTFKLTADDYAGTVGEQVLTDIPARGPGKSEFFRVHPDPDYVATAALLQHEREFFLVDPGLRATLRQELKPVELYVCQTRTKAIFLWPIRLPGEDGKDNPWWASARLIAQEARSCFVRCVAGRGVAGYVMTKIVVEVPDPEWPDKSLRDLCELAFKLRHISSLDHPIVKLLLGRI